ncbi:MAG: LysM peptidoglycan-binding domain-containing protein [Verrucomicrobia bacterium]|nr:MAG: LysM peptidoglycan-binding domain-containing protein [Verrucomicrobiota bacterium]TAE89279.1 MAG: LysM peptidoglycan-binding domain-containing protein [Verrucomicrobiota bacterium]TAF27847.1 MAG: LysM peptidoglycan-binding domain-containing protein [Verrucomicrobiota bacterium]TAF42696.1 MAG: LysM peptidoglycan-binding domain-containing protein [Verrucomicrobiota bacterium]
MQSRWLALSAAVLTVVLSSCSDPGSLIASNHPTGTGPFDSRGNYVEAWADSPSKWRRGATQVVNAQPERPTISSRVNPPMLVANPSSNSQRPPQRNTNIASNTIKPRPVARKPTAPIRPKTVRHAVRSGDNLYNIAKRYGTSVGAIQRANSIRGSMIRPGQSLVIPR